jgi:hypothetical protein
MDLLAATFKLFTSIDSIPVSVEQVNDVSVIGVDRFPFKLTFSNNYTLACMMAYTPDQVMVWVYKYDGYKYHQVIHA